MTPERLSQIEELYHSARQCEPGQRRPFLAAVCKGDEELLRDVESRLAADSVSTCLVDGADVRQNAWIEASQQSRVQYRFAPGLELGPYMIEARIGAGGMGEVYRAKDKRLHRTVALKVLPERLAHTPFLRQRLEREGKAISSLNHPQICTLYDIGREGDVDYLVMEFLEGDTLAQRLTRGVLPLPEALQLAVQIASGLSVAHTTGIVHRDLKPSNIMLTKSGAKLLDFGLAKTSPAVAVAGAATSSQSEPITAPGMVLGTAQYMSPEQIQGHEADARSDLFAFGATLYEMLTGKSAFTGASQFAVMSAILEKDPGSVREKQPVVPPALERVVRRCLEKNPENRWQNASDLASELSWIAETGVTPVIAAGREQVVSNRRRSLLFEALSVIFLVAAILSSVAYWRVARTPAQTVTAEITSPDKVRFKLPAVGGEPALSPDGRLLAYTGVDESGNTMIWIRSLDSPTTRALPGTAGASDPFWSPDSQRIGFSADGKLKAIAASGGPALIVARDNLDNLGGSWSRDGTIVFTPDVTKGLSKVSAAGGDPIPFIRADPRAPRAFCCPKFLPDGQHFLYASFGPSRASVGTYFASMDGKENRLILAGTSAIYASGFLLYLREDTLVAQSFDPERGRLRSDQVHRVADHVSRSADFTHNSFDASENGILVYGTNSAASEKRLLWFDRTGKNQGSTGGTADYWDVRLSPDGQKLASNSGTPNSEIWIDDLARGVRMRLTADPDSDDGDPVWSPNGSRIAFAAHGEKRWGIYQKYSNGVGGEELLLASRAGRITWPTSWSPDGRFILYSREAARQDGGDIWILPLTGDRAPSPFVQTPAIAYDGQFSPNGRWVAYVSEESGRADVYVAPFDADQFMKSRPASAVASGGDRWLLSSNGGRCPRWRKDGKEIFYLSSTNQLMAAEIDAEGPAKVVRTAQALFQCTPNYSLPLAAYYDVTPDGKKFVINSYGDDHPTLNLLVNWTANLNQ